MARPVSREQFKQYCLRRLGKPVIDINVDDEQLEDRIDDALQYYRDYHYDGTEKLYLQFQITQTDKDNKFLTLPETITGVTGVFDIGDSLNTQNLFDVRYQIHLNDLSFHSYGNMAPYVMAMRHIETLEENFVGKKPIRYNRHMDRLFIEMDWNADVTAGNFIIIDCYGVIDPDVWTDMWNDPWMQRYGTALMKRQWGDNLSKFAGLQLPGGVTFDGPRIAQEARDEIEKLESEMNSSYSLPVMDMMN